MNVVSDKPKICIKTTVSGREPVAPRSINLLIYRLLLFDSYFPNKNIFIKFLLTTTFLNTSES